MTIVDSTAEEIGTDLVEATFVGHPPALFGTDDPREIVQRAAEVASTLAAVIDRQRLFTTVQGKNHVHVDGWQLLGVMLGVTAVCTHTEAVDGGFKATVEARTADGRVVGRADALCTKHEKRGPWKNSDDYARLSMAQTRATSKALKGPLGFVISLAGYASTPAEEMTFAEPDPPASPAQSLELLSAAMDAMKLAGIDTETANKAVAGADDDKLRRITAKAIARAKELQEPPPQDGPPLLPSEKEPMPI